MSDEGEKLVELAESAWNELQVWSEMVAMIGGEDISRYLVGAVGMLMSACMDRLFEESDDDPEFPKSEKVRKGLEMLEKVISDLDKPYQRTP